MFMKGNIVALTSVLLVAFAQSVLAQSAIETAIAATVTIEVSGPDGVRLGSGFITSSDGMIITAANVLEGATSATVRFQNGEELNVEGVIAIDAVRDFAIVRVAGFDLPTVTLGNTDDVSVGQRVIAISAPLDPTLAGTVSNGLVTDDLLLDGTRIIVISAPTLLEHSGGPVLTEQGQVIGLVVSGAATTASQDLHFSLPINYVRGQLSLAATRPLQPLAEIQEAVGPRVTVRSRDTTSVTTVSPATRTPQQISVNPSSVHKKISGIGLASVWGLTVIGSAAMEDDYLWTTVLPVLGPWVTMARVEDRSALEQLLYGDGYLPGGKASLIISGTLQGALLVYFVTSVIRNNSSSSSQFSVSPIFNARGNGLALTYRF